MDARSMNENDESHKRLEACICHVFAHDTKYKLD